MAGVDLEQGGDRAGHGVGVVAGSEQRGGAVLAAQAQLEGLHAGGAGLAVAVGGALGVAQPLDLGLEPLVLGGGALVGLVEALLALLVDGDGRLEGGELALGLGGPGGGGPGAAAQPLDLRLARLDPGRLGADLALQPGQALAAVGDGAGDRARRCCSAA